MNWILEHLQIIVAVAAAIAYWLNQRKREQAGESADYDADGTPEVPRRDFQSDPEEEARTRQIQEEIRRKIAERAGGGPITLPPPAPEPPPLFREQTLAPRPVATEPTLRDFRRESAPPPVMAPSNHAAVLERQQELAEQLRILEETRRTTQRKAALVAAATAKDTVHPFGPRGDLLADLRGARNLRRAMVLREVLGPPVGLR